MKGKIFFRGFWLRSATFCCFFSSVCYSFWVQPETDPVPTSNFRLRNAACKAGSSQQHDKTNNDSAILSQKTRPTYVLVRIVEITFLAKTGKQGLFRLRLQLISSLIDLTNCDERQCLGFGSLLDPYSTSFWILFRISDPGIRSL